MHLFLNTQTHTPNFNAYSLLTYLLFQFPVPVNYSLQIADDFIYTSVVNWLTVVFFCMFGILLIRPDHHWQSNWRVAWRLRACQKADTSSNYSSVWQDTLVFLLNVTRFVRFVECCFFLKIRTSKFYKVVRQHTQRAPEKATKGSLKISRRNPCSPFLASFIA